MHLSKEDEAAAVAAVYDLIASMATARDGVPRGTWDDLPEDRRPALRAGLGAILTAYEGLSERYCLL